MTSEKQLEKFNNFDDFDEIEEIDLDEIPDSLAGYSYSGFDALGRKLTLHSYANTAETADKELRAVGISTTNLKPLTLKKKKRHLPKLMEMATLARNFGEQIEAGNHPLQICKMLAEAESNETLAEALHGVVSALHNGKELHTAFDMQRDHKGRAVFDREFITAIQIGIIVGAAQNQETEKKESGLMMTLRRYAESREKSDKIRASIRSAMMYPSAVAITAIAAVAVVTIFVMPIMEQMYKALLQGKKDQSLPFLTQIMLDISHFVWSFWGLVCGVALVGSVAALLKWWRSPSGQDFKGRTIIKLPGFGNFYRMLYASQLLRYLSMLSDGIGDIGARFRLASETTQNPVYREMLESFTYLARTQGSEITPLFKPYLFLFGREFLGQLMTADTTGNHAAPFYRYAQMLEIKVNRQLESVLMLMKIVVMFPLGLVVATIVAAIILPFFQLAGRLAQ